MAPPRIHIENLRIRLPRSAAGTAATARALADRVGREVLRRMAVVARDRTGMVRIDNVNTGPLRAGHGANEISSLAGERIAAEVSRKLGRKDAR